VTKPTGVGRGHGRREGYLQGVPDISEVDLAWLAGLLEGEGCFSTPSPGAPCRIYIQMTDQDVMEKVGRLVNRRVGRNHPPSHRDRGWKPTYRVVINGRPARTWMLRLYPFMGARRREKIDQILQNFDHNKVRKPLDPAPL